MVGMTRRKVSFEVGLGLVLLGLSLLYAVTFSHMLRVSLEEQVFHRDATPPRFIGRAHSHNHAEWVLLAAPAAIGWLGSASSAAYLARRIRTN
jgi:hypothetical protein